jgi:hypothetical protein
MDAMAETLKAHTPGTSESEVSSVGLSSLFVMASHVDIFAWQLSNSCKGLRRGSGESTDGFLQHFYLKI